MYRNLFRAWLDRTAEGSCPHVILEGVKVCERAWLSPVLVVGNDRRSK
jgi:hypothetical protein